MERGVCSELDSNDDLGWWLQNQWYDIYSRVVVNTISTLIMTKQNQRLTAQCVSSVLLCSSYV